MAADRAAPASASTTPTADGLVDSGGLAASDASSWMMTAMPEMIDPAGEGDLALPMPESRTSEEMAAEGPHKVLALPTPSTDETEQEEADSEQQRAVGPGAVWVSVPSPPPVPQDVTWVWHYTDAGGLIGILTSNILRATSLSSLNDSAEYKYGRELLAQIMVEVLRSRHIHPAQKRRISQLVDLSDTLSSRPGQFVVCASEAAHSLAQWRAYGRGQGHAVLLDPKVSLAIISDRDSNHRVDTPQLMWRRVVYEREEQLDLILATLGFFAFSSRPDDPAVSPERESDRADAMLLVHMLSHIKEPSFAEEREVRMVGQAPNLLDIKFRSGQIGVVPYLELTGAEGEARLTTAKPRPLPIIRVVVGPFAGREASADGVVTLVRSTDYVTTTDVAIETSTLR